jgi:hypothetical protein
MKTLFSAIFKFIAFILAGALMIVIPLALMANNGGDVLFNQEQLNEITTGVVLDSELIPAALEIMTNNQARDISSKIEDTDNPAGRELNLYNLIYSMEDIHWRNLKAALLTDEVIASWIEVTVNGFYNWLDTDDQVPFISWNLRPVIDKMSGPQGEEAVEAFFDSLPDCSDLQMEKMQTGPGEPLPRSMMVEELCKLSTFSQTEQIEVYKDVLRMVVEATPPEYNTTQALLKQREQIGGIYTLKWRIRTIRWQLDTVMIVPLGLFFLILFFGVRSMEGLGQWFGIPLIGGGLISLITALLYRPLWRGWLAERIPEEAIPQTSLLYHELIDASARVLGPIFNPLAWQSFIILLLGIGLLAMGFILRMRRTSDKTS